MASAMIFSDSGAAFTNVPCAAVSFRYSNSDVKLIWANDKYFSLLGYTKAEYLELIPNDSGFRILEREYSAYIVDKVTDLVKNCSDFTIDIDVVTVNGEKLPVSVEVSAERDGEDYIFNCLLRTVTDAKKSSKNNSDMNTMMLELMAISAGYVFRYTEISGIFELYSNVGGSFVKKFTLDDFEQFFKKSGSIFEEDTDSFEQLCTNIKSGIDKGVFEMRLMMPGDNDYRWYRINVKTIRDKISNSYISTVGKIEDISGVKNANQRLIDKAERDPLTKLYNKAATKSLIKNCLRTDSRDTYDAFIIVDVDNFKTVNDTLGHLFGDSVLVELSQEMQDLFRSNDIIGRIGGDEFIVFLRGLKQKSHIEAKAADLCKVFSLIYSDEDDGVKISGSLGIALYPDDGDTFDELYRKADIALYTSKRAGKSCYNFYKSGDEIPTEGKPVPRVDRYHSTIDFLSGNSGLDSEVFNSAFEMVENGGDMNESVNVLLSKIGKHFNFGRITVSEAREETGVFRDSYVWNAKYMESPRTNAVKYSLRELNEVCSCFDKNFLFTINTQNTDRLKENAFVSYLTANNIKSAMTCGYFKSGRLVGTVSFQEQSAAYVWSIEEAKSLKELTRIIFSYMIKLRNYYNAVETAEYSANFDALTGLLNFNSFRRETSERLSSAFDNDRFAMLMADFSNFSYINNKFGYDAGDNLLKSFSNAIKYFSDSVIYVCRIVADRFCVFAEYNENIISDFEAFLRKFASNEKLTGGNTSFGISSGAYIIDSAAGEDFDRAYDNANLSLKFAKQHRVGKCCVYSYDMRDELNKTIEIAADAKRALANKEFIVYFQPKVSIKNKDIVGAEALIRWIKPDGTVVPADSFVPMLEKNGFIVNVDYFVYEEVCKYLRNRIESGKAPIAISVNVSRIHMLSGDFISKLLCIVKKYHVPAELIELELTESVFNSNEEIMIETVTKLKELGFKVSIDDFGSGYSSLSLLKRMPVDVLKIDREFIRNTSEEKGEIVLSSVIDMADKMNISIICEGVETAEQIDFLRGTHCDTVQGFYYSRPIPCMEFEELLDNGIR